jgi:hypothetical protein
LFDPAAYQVPLRPEDAARLAASTLEEDERGRLHLPSRLNAHIGGRVTLHFGSRDVVLPVDGATALRIVAHYRSPERSELADVLNPHTSSASNAWMAFDLREPLAVSWQPDLARRTTRTTFDPPA